VGAVINPSAVDIIDIHHHLQLQPSTSLHRYNATKLQPITRNRTRYTKTTSSSISLLHLAWIIVE